MFRALFGSVLLVLLAGCSFLPGGGGGSDGGGRYSIKQDRPPDETDVDVSKIPNAVPRVEAKSRGGNKSRYEVFGKTYYVLPSSAGYKERGEASWYGKKFHGHKTSNGEIYDMFAMTAAHKSLPLPTYVQVTNLKNNRKIIVRVNDRGPFHQGRIIDLSFVAAKKLDMLGGGVTQVEVEAIDPRTWQSARGVVAAGTQATSQQSGKKRYLQVGAFSLLSSAEQASRELNDLFGNLPVRIVPLAKSDRTLYRVQLGPVDFGANLAEIVSKVEAAGFAQPHLVD
ncbi:septal ring lytic transglycosylase RlpA family protein [Aliamphritea ceti]|uniref:septal ring lytic transglycosylase RlpA family protein n=1 Tax=Aliamphritea ceti TaxID=1524258 RepID=UPI0021C271DF|nr:septal ring lytic transglycosylase RlpA family protein [Aliamphritea ceti]